MPLITPRLYYQDSPLIIALIHKQYGLAKILIKNGADVTYFGLQKVNSFSVIHKRKLKSLMSLVKQYFSTKKYKELELKYRNLEDDFMEVKNHNPRISQITNLTMNTVQSLPLSSESCKKGGETQNATMPETGAQSPEKISSAKYLEMIRVSADQITQLQNAI